MSEIKKYKKDPRDGGIYLFHQLILREEEWLASPESNEGDWESTRFGPLVVATKITFLMGVRLGGAKEGG